METPIASPSAPARPGGGWLVRMSSRDPRPILRWFATRFYSSAGNIRTFMRRFVEPSLGGIHGSNFKYSLTNYKMFILRNRSSFRSVGADPHVMQDDPLRAFSLLQNVHARGDAAIPPRGS